MQLTKLITIVFGVAAAYFLTIQSLKVELAAKAETQSVENLNRKLTNIEVILREGVVGKEQFYKFSKDIERRLIRIETLLEENKGESFDKR
ncbi:MAG: hypothetical protein DWP97_06085 [Calditrichaeota bacterium]|nr:MAG: hypothetical protein DWP97_06085 [Calditrichota bacterium]